MSWLPDPSHSKSRDYKYAEMLELYWQVKGLVAFAIESGNQNSEILQRLDDLDKKYDNNLAQLDSRYDGPTKAIWGSKACSDVVQEVEVETEVGNADQAGK
jgi:hypothetical protein